MSNRISRLFKNNIKATLLPLGMLVIVMLQSSLLHAQQQITVRGKVIDTDTKEELIGVAVVITELRIGAATNINGVYSFLVPKPGTYTLEAKLIGYNTKKATITLESGKTATQDFEMKVRASEAEEVLVLGLTGEVDKSKLGNSIGVVGEEKINNVPSSSAIDALAGNVAGVQVNRASGVPGGSSFINVRGPKSALGTNEPVFIVDGVIMDNTQQASNPANPNANSTTASVDAGSRASDINPQDIESMQILKGPAAAAIYGALGANGIVLITTKRGKYNSMERPTKISGELFTQTTRQLGTLDLQTTFGQGDNGLEGPGLSYQEAGSGAAGTTVSQGRPGGTATWGPLLTANTPVFDQLDGVLRVPSTNGAVVSFSGALPSIDYFIGGTFLGDQGVFRNSDLARYNVRLNATINPLNNLSIKTSTNYINQNNNLPTVGNSTSGVFLSALRTPPNFQSSRYLEPNGTQRRYAVYDNPIWSQENVSFLTRVSRIIHSSQAQLDVVRGTNGFTFNVRAQVGLDRYDQGQDVTFPRGALDGGFSAGGIGSNNRAPRTDNQLNLELTTNFGYQFSNNLDFKLVAGGNRINFDRFGVDVNTSGAAGILPFDQLNAASGQVATSFQTSSVLVSQFFQGTVSVFQWLNLTASATRQGSSTFGTVQPFQWFPRASFALSFSEQGFMQPLKGIVDNIILRGAYGEAGNPSLPAAYATNFLYGPFGAAAPFATATSPNSGSNIGINASTAGGASQAVVPERSIEREIGMELTLLGNRANLEANYYYTNINDMILSFPLPISTGYNTVLRNAGFMYNQGWELVLGVDVVRASNFTWRTSMNYARFISQVTDLRGAPFVSLGGFAGSASIIKAGQPYGAIQSNAWMRDVNGNIVYSGQWVQANSNGTLLRDSQNRVTVVAPNTQGAVPIVGALAADVANLSAINALINAPVQDQILNDNVGVPWPAYTLSFRNDFRVMKNINLSVLLDGQFGLTVFNGTLGGLRNFGTIGESRDRDLLAYNENGGRIIVDPARTAPVAINGINYLPGQQINRTVLYRSFYNGFNIAEPSMEDGSFLRLREVSLTYSWGGLRRWGVGDVTVSFIGRNLATFFNNYTGYDPEVNSFGNGNARGIDWFQFAQVRSYRIGVQFTY
jgi:TonB-linked SusC/RagA family outer membrane protein